MYTFEQDPEGDFAFVLVLDGSIVGHYNVQAIVIARLCANLNGDQWKGTKVGASLARDLAEEHADRP